MNDVGIVEVSDDSAHSQSPLCGLRNVRLPRGECGVTSLSGEKIETGSLEVFGLHPKVKTGILLRPRRLFAVAFVINDAVQMTARVK